jgi:hypothetical protein
MSNYSAVRDWFDENLMRVQMTVYTSSNYILADAIRDAIGIEVSPALVHEVAVSMGYTPEYRHKTCFAYNAKFRITPKDEAVTMADFEGLPTRHPHLIAFAQVGVDGPVYLTITTNLRGRMVELDKLNPYNIHLRGIMRGGYNAMYSLVQAFETHLIKDNWYEPAPEILKFIYQSGQVEIEH